MERELSGLSNRVIVLAIEVHRVTWTRTIGVGLSTFRQSYYQEIREGYEENCVNY